MMNYKWVQGALSVALIAILGAILIPGAGAAPAAQGVLAWNAAPVTGALDAATPRALYMFPCEANYPGSVVVETTSGNLVTQVTVVGPGFVPLGTGQQVAGTQGTVLEAFLPADRGTCQAEISAVNNTSGQYAVSLRSGYGTVRGFNTFDQASEPAGFQWVPFQTDNVIGDLVNNAVQISVITQNMFGYFATDDPIETATNAFMQADVAIQGQPSYVEYGLEFGMAEDGSTFYSLAFSTDGDYSLYFYQDGWTALREWTVSEVIDATDSNPQIAIWLHDGSLAVFFNGALVEDIPNIDPNAFLGYPGISAGTLADQTDTVTVQYDNFLVTVPYTGAASTGLLGALGMGNNQGTPPQRSTPTPEPLSLALPTAAPQPTQAQVQVGNFPASLQNWNTNQPSVLVSELANQGYIPLGGSVKLNVPSTFGESSSQGFNYYPLGRGEQYADFVASFDATLTTSGPGSGCGMHFRASNTTSTSSLVFADGFAMLAYYGADGSPDDASFMDYTDLVTTGVGVTHRVTVVAVGSKMAMYVNGQLLADTEFPMGTGTASLELYVEADSTGATQLTRCQLDNVWLWGF